MLESIKLEREKPPKESIPQLADWILQLSNATNREEGRRPVFDAAQSALLSIPGHAEYYRDRINEERAKLDTLNPEVNSVTWNEQRTRWKDAKAGFGVMANLPSCEVVRVLGDYLSDDRGKIPLPPRATHDQMESWAARWPHSHNALLALNHLPIVAKPYQRRTGSGAFSPFEMEDAVMAWRQWYEEIKNGQRTFRFEGDPTEYDLNGPAPKEKLERIALANRRDAERVGTGGHGSPASGGPVQGRGTNGGESRTIPVAIAVGLVLAALAAWRFMGRRPAC